MNLFNLEGKTALITGASSGLGARFAEVILAAGGKVIIAARRKNLLNELAYKLNNTDKITAIKLDVNDKQQVKDAIKAITKNTKIDILINNAGIVCDTPIFANEENNDFENIIQTNLNATWYVTKAVAQHMKVNSIAGSIINIGSIYGANKLDINQVAYCASKAAINQFTKALVGELSPFNIRINAINPGFFNTPMSPPKFIEANNIKQSIPLGYVAEPHELDGCILFLASNSASSYVTGTSITIDGGISWGGMHNAPF